MPEDQPFSSEPQIERDGVRVRTRGSLDMATAPVLDAQLDDLHTAGVRRVIIDLSGLDFMDSSGLRLLLKWRTIALQKGVALELVPGTPTVQRVFDVTGTSQVLPFRAQ